MGDSYQNDFSRRRLIGLATSLGMLAQFNLAYAAQKFRLAMYAVPTCDCCIGWARYMESAGFEIEVRMLESIAEIRNIKRRFDLPEQLDGCHTSVIDDYIFEGHVAAKDVTEILSKKTKIRGLAVPNMPKGSPGMEAPVAQRYSTYAIPFEGEPWVFREHNKP